MKWITPALVLLLIMLSAVMTISIVTNLQSVDAADEPQVVPEYHFQVIAQSSNEIFWLQFSEGAKQAAKEKNVYVEFVDADGNSPESSVKAIKRAVYSDVDGVAFQPQDSTLTKEAVEMALKNEVCTVTFENDIYNFDDTMTVGSNGYEIGYEMGRMCASACQNKADVAVIVNNMGDSTASYKNIKVQGVVDAFSEHPDMVIQDIYTIDSEVFEIDKLTNDILRDNPDVDVILCMDEKNTPNVAQVLVDASKVGDVTVIGYGAMPQTIDYIERGVIYGTVCADGYQIGYSTVMQLYSQISGGSVIDTYSTDIYRITKENVNEYNGG